MEGNLKIIKAVQSQPALYKKNATITDRQRGWHELSKQLDLKEDFLRTRWHFLSVGYKRYLEDKRVYFKYTTEMEFLRPHINLQSKAVVMRGNKSVQEPEFVITEKDIETESENDDYVFLEVETLEGCVQEESTMETDTEPEETAVHCSQNIETEQQVDTPQISLKSQDAIQTTEIATESDRKKVASEVRINYIPPKLDNVSVKIEHDTTNEKKEENSDEVKKVTTKTNSDRDEDDIFGELVTAMLKRLPTDKKKRVKKDIMNILFTY